MGGKRWSEEDINYLKEHWPTKGSSVVGQFLGRDWRAVQKMAYRHNLSCDMVAIHKQYGKILEESNTSCLIRYFEGDFKPNFAYTLGYIYADGCINKAKSSLCFLCHTKDEEIILAIRGELQSKHKVTRRPPKEYIDSKGRRRNGPRTTINVTSTYLVRTLIDRFGVQPRKSLLDLPMPSNIPDQMMGHFVRGVWDGDGHVSSDDKRGRASVVGTKLFLEQMVNSICKLTGLKMPAMTKQKKIYSVEWARHEDVKTLRSFLYPEGDYIYLRRKRQAFDVISTMEIRDLVPWTKEDENVVLEKYKSLGPTHLAEILGRTYASIRAKALLLGVV